ncbi:MAG TPA: DUF4097 family beta strand repeat-containing protein [Gemmatimonadales bacterium]
MMGRPKSLSRSELPAASLGLAVLAVFALAQNQDSYSLSGDRIAVYNLAGQITIEPGTGSAVTIEVRPGGRDAGELRVETGPIRGRETLRVLYPADRIVYDRGGARNRFQTQIRVDEDGTFGDSDRDSWRGRNRRDRVEITSGGRGLDAYADLTISVPRGQEFALYLGVGEISATNVDGTIRLDGSATSVTATGSRGQLVIDVGSGGVRVTDAEGDVDIDTGSGSVEVSGARGDIFRVDTGSGSVTASQINARNIDIDTGSGRINLRGATALNVRLDTGSGSVEAELDPGAADIEVDTGSGGVHLTLPADFGATVDIETGSGGIELDFPVEVRRWERDHVRGTIGDGRGRLMIDTGSGSVTIRKK